MRLDGGEWVFGHRMDELFPQQSVSKTWVALTVLDMVDQGKLRLDQKVKITRDDLAVFHQPIRDQVIANGSIEVSVLNLLETSIRASDNTANDSLLRTVGGPQAVTGFIARKNFGRDPLWAGRTRFAKPHCRSRLETGICNWSALLWCA
jgi:beta-lactamase class A